MQARHPKLTEVGPKPKLGLAMLGTAVVDLNDTVEFIKPTGAEMASYQANYDAWLADLRSFLKGTPATLDAKFLEQAFMIGLGNTGMRPAEGVRLEFEVSEGFLLRKDDPTTAGNGAPLAVPLTRFRQPPKAPAWRKAIQHHAPSHPGTGLRAALTAITGQDRHLDITSGQVAALTALGHLGAAGDFARASEAFRWAAGRNDIAAINAGLLPGRGMAEASIVEPVGFTIPPMPVPRLTQREDPHAFYWERGGHVAPVRLWRLRCQEFQHGQAPEEFSGRVFLGCSGEAPSEGWMEVRLWARNLVEPYSKRISIRVEETNADVQKLMASTLP